MVNKKLATKSGFTLIELLVVISIIALLVSILMPALAKARKAARTTVCQSRLRQIAFGMIYYADANNDTVLTVGGNNPNGAISYYWYDELAEHMGVKGYKEDPAKHRDGIMKIINCPEVKKEPIESKYWGSFDRPWYVSFSAGLGSLSKSAGSYTINGWVEQRGYYGSTIKENYFSKKFTVIPGEVPIFSDGMWVDTWVLSTDAPPVSIDDPDGYSNFNVGMQRICIDRHDKKINIAHIDGHVEKFGLAELWQQKWHKGYGRRSSDSILKAYPNFAKLL
ncbi:MAG: type II secretion system protein [Phycisphaerae bacterium]|nr:type II secretion system protein [Phycisphaerae bacterium]